MTYNSIIRVSGVEKPVILSKANAEEVRAIFENREIPQDFVLRVRNQSFRKGQIRQIEIIADNNRVETFDEEQRKSIEEERKMRVAFLSKPVEMRARSLDPFKLFYKCVTGNEPSQDALRQVYEVQLVFFRDNPNRMICDPRLWRSLVPKVYGHEEKPFQGAFFRVLTAAVSNDLEKSGYKYGEIKPAMSV